MARFRNPFKTTASSQEITSVQIRAQLEQQNHSEFVLVSGTGNRFTDFLVETVTGRSLGSRLSPSLMPRRQRLDTPVTKLICEGLLQQAKTAKQINEQERLRADIPTADYVKRNGFKVGTKLLIKIAPSASTTSEEKQVPNLVFDRFSLQGIAEPDEERYQLHETFESEVLFLFGRRPRIWTMQGIVLNGKRTEEAPANETDAERELRLSRDSDFANTLLQDWEDYYRGTRSVEARAKTYISYEESVIEGTLLGLTMVRNAQIPSAANATLTFVVHERNFLGQSARNGLTTADLQDLILGSGVGNTNEDKGPPSDIVPATPTKEEIQRREANAQAVEGSSRATAEDLVTERDNLAAHIAEQKEIIAQAQASADAAAEGLEQANAAAAAAEEIGDIDARDAALADAAAAQQGIDEAQAASSQAEAVKQQNEARKEELDAEITAAMSANADDQQAADTLTATSEATSEDSGQSLIDDNGQSVEP